MESAYQFSCDGDPWGSFREILKEGSRGTLQTVEWFFCIKE